MSFNGSGTFNLATGNPVVTGTTISSTWANNTLSDIATGLSNCITRDGQSPATANIPMGTHKLTGLSAGTTAGDSARYEQVTSAVAITGGAIDGTPIGGTTPAVGAFTTLSASSAVTLSGGTANGVLYLNGSKVATSGSALTFDGTNLGIGTSSPSSYGNLAVYKASGANIVAAVNAAATISDYSQFVCYTNGTANYLQNILYGNGNAYSQANGTYTSGSTGSNPCIFITANTERMRIDSSGNVGIGTSSPGGDATNRSVSASGSSSASFNSVCGTVTTNYASTTGNGLLGTASNHALVLQTNNTERMRIDSSGNVGIGTSSPSTYGKFAVVGSNTGGAVVNYFANLWTTTTANTQVVISLDAGGNGYNIRDSQIRATNNGSNQTTLEFYTANAATPAERMRIDSSGNVGIGTSTPSQKLSAGGGTGAQAININGGNTNSGDGAQLIIQNGGNTSGGIGNYSAVFGGAYDSTIAVHGYYGLRFFTVGSERMRIDSSGNLQFNSGYGSAAIAYGCRAWVNFNGTGTVAIRASGNVSSITDNGTGDYTVNLTTAMPDVNYTTQVSSSASYSTTATMTNIATGNANVEQAPTTTAIRFQNSSWNGTTYDSKYVSVAIFR